jgi:hypothetical protein
MISALYNLSLPRFNEEWHPWDNIVGRMPGGPIRDGTTGRVPGAPASLIYKVSIKEYSVLNICFERWDHAVLQSFLSWRDTTHQFGLGGNAFDLRKISPGVSPVGVVGCRISHGVKDAAASSLDGDTANTKYRDVEEIPKSRRPNRSFEQPGNLRGVDGAHGLRGGLVVTRHRKNHRSPRGRLFFEVQFSGQ